MITAAPTIPVLTISQWLLPATNSEKLDESLQFDWALYQGTSYKELLIAIALCRILQKERDDKHRTMATATLLHSIITSYTCLTQRVSAPTWPAQAYGGSTSFGKFLESFCKEVMDIMKSNMKVILERDLDWDLYDIIDGRLLLSLHVALSKGQSLPVALIDRAKPLFTCIERWSGVSLLDKHYLRVSTGSEAERSDIEVTTTSHNLIKGTILPFNHKLLNKFLEPIQLQTTHIQEEASETRVFQELTHWHNAKRALESKGGQKKPGFFARKRNQKFMADTLVYSASLTNAAGKLVEPKSIIVGGAPTAPRKPLTNRTMTDLSKGKKKTGSNSGKQSARETALLVQAQKLKERNSATFRHWHTVADEFSQETSLAKRFQKANKYFLSLTKEDRIAIGAEVSLYLCDTLHRAWEEQAAATSTQQGKPPFCEIIVHFADDTLQH